MASERHCPNLIKKNVATPHSYRCDQTPNSTEGSQAHGIVASGRHCWTKLFRKNAATPRRHQCDNTPNSAEGVQIRTARWNPTREQIRILKDIFNSGEINPSKQRIPKITAELQQFGEVRDANVFYWFQNRKSKSKQRQRDKANQERAKVVEISSSNADQPDQPTANESFSSHDQPDQATISDKIGPKNIVQMGGTSYATTPPAATRNHLDDGQQKMKGKSIEQLSDIQVPICRGSTNGGINNDNSIQLCNTEASISRGATGVISNEVAHLGNNSGISGLPQPQTYDAYLLNEVHFESQPYSDHITTSEFLNFPHNFMPYDGSIIHANTGTAVDSFNGRPITVFINKKPYEVPMGPINLRAVFGHGVILVDQFGQQVAVNERGITLQGLQHAASYYLVF